MQLRYEVSACLFTVRWKRKLYSSSMKQELTNTYLKLKGLLKKLPTMQKLSLSSVPAFNHEAN